jgi:pSer/pThr/pTyr-binding forkhead associated (FHA) protein
MEFMASVIIQTGEHRGNYYPLGHRTTIIGRDEAATVQIVDEHASRKHMKIQYDPQTNDYIAVDMKSKHGVLINGNRMQINTVLSDDDLITVGKTTILFTLKDFDDTKSALHHLKKVGERVRGTILE